MKQKIVAILPAYNARRTLGTFVSGLLRNVFDEIILVDDCSTDGTLELANKQKGITVYQTPRNMGYGGNLKLCFSKALEHGADVIVELHPDGEYWFDGIEPALLAVQKGAKLVLGNRFVHGRPAGMLPIKYVVSRFLTFVYNLILGMHVPDMHQGFRVYTRTLLTTINWKDFTNDFLFSFQMIIAAQKNGFSITSVPVTARYRGIKRGATWGNSVRYTLGTVRAFFTIKKQTHARCPICQTDVYAHQKYTYKQYAVYECQGCETAFTWPQPNNMESFYPSVLGIWKNRIFPKAPRRQIEWFQRIVSGGNVLDVGSGEGRFAKSLPSGYRVTNLDPYNKHADIVSFERRGLTKLKYDAVVFWESLEHVPDPVENLKTAYELLKPGGYLFVEYPRYESLDRKVFGRYWLHLDVPRHLFHFTSRGLERIVGAQRFVVRVNTSVVAWEYGTSIGLLVAFKPVTMRARV